VLPRDYRRRHGPTGPCLPTERFALTDVIPTRAIRSRRYRPMSMATPTQYDEDIKIRLRRRLVPARKSR